ncbi:unnamed protein product [Fusarium fujikuroi]|uniref:Uncharacterized protein n=1 Tax=Fusarium fujikuroi TaxID=5127 RepID=A0A9Q9U7H1_FUSFU|nr:unnamed protein product [Fusarium fujikuroi]
MNLQNLPQELIYIISQRVLHHSYGFPERSDRGDVRFCRTICEKPELGRFVKRIYLRQMSQLDWDLDKDDDAWLLKSLDKFSDILNLPPKPFNFSKGAWSSFIIPLILLQIPTVEDLQIDTRNLEHLMQQIKKPPESHLHTFPQNVVKVTMSEGPHCQEVFPLRGPFDLSDTAGGGLLSNIRGFDILIIGNPTRQTIKSPLQLDSVRTLHLIDVCLGREELQLLVSATGPLEVFKYMGGFTQEPNPATAQDICEVLTTKKDTLTEAAVLTHYKARYLTAARTLENVTWLRITTKSIWKRTESEPTLHDQALVDIFPPALSTIIFEADREDMEGLSAALTKYILSNCPDNPEDQILKSVQIHIHLGIPPEGVRNPPVQEGNPSCEKIRHECALFLERGYIEVNFDRPAVGSTAEIPLPPEAKEHRQTIINLSFVCKRWGYIAQKVLHHHCGYFETHPKAEFLFCRTLSKNSELGKHVKEARIRQISTYDWSLDEEWLARSLNKFSVVLDFPEASSLPDISIRGEFIAPLIFFQVPTLDRLSIQNEHLNEIMRKFRALFLGKQCVVPRNLSEACLGGLLSASPGVHDLTLYNPNPQSLRNRPSLSNLRTLTLSAAFIREELRLLLSFTGPLDIFTYYDISRPDFKGVTIQDICDLLISKKHSLAKLHFQTLQKYQYFTTAKSLINVNHLRFRFGGFWSPTDAEPILEEHALLDIFPPNLSTLWLDVSEFTILGILDALTNYILSTFRDQPVE